MTLFCGVPGMAAQAVLAKKNFTTVQEEVKIAAVTRWPVDCETTQLYTLVVKGSMASHSKNVAICKAFHDKPRLLGVAIAIDPFQVV